MQSECLAEAMYSRGYTEGYKLGYLFGWGTAANLTDYLVIHDRLTYFEALHVRGTYFESVADWQEDDTRTEHEEPIEFPPDPPYSMPELRPGFIYILRADNGLYKIGRTRTLDDRINQLGVMLPYELELVHVIETDDMYAAEQAMHRLYAQVRVRSEWFALTDEDVAHIKDMCLYFGYNRVG